MKPDPDQKAEHYMQLFENIMSQSLDKRIKILPKDIIPVLLKYREMKERIKQMESTLRRLLKDG